MWLLWNSQLTHLYIACCPDALTWFVKVLVVATVCVCVYVGASVNARDHRKRTPLHVAAEKGEEELITFLLDKKADSNIADLDGNTPLDLAAKKEYEPAFNLLLTHAYSSKKDDVVKKTLKKAMTSERVKDDLVREKIGEMSPFGYVLGEGYHA